MAHFFKNNIILTNVCCRFCNFILPIFLEQYSAHKIPWKLRPRKLDPKICFFLVKKDAAISLLSNSFKTAILLEIFHLKISQVRFVTTCRMTTTTASAITTTRARRTTTTTRTKTRGSIFSYFYGPIFISLFCFNPMLRKSPACLTVRSSSAYL